MLSLDERLELFRVVKDAAGSRVPLVGGACSYSTRDIVRLAQEAEKLEFDAIMVLGP